MSTATVFLIVGLDRSGTSVTARMVDRLGVPIHNPGGESHNHAAYNPTGYYEDVAVNKELDRCKVDRIRALAQDYGSQTAWGLKDPRLAWPDNLWKAVHAIQLTSEDVRLIVTARPIADIAASRIRCGGHGTVAYLTELHDKMWNAILETGRPFHVVHFNALFDDTYAETRKLAEFVGLNTSSIWAIKKMRAAEDAIDKTQRHFNG